MITLYVKFNVHSSYAFFSNVIFLNSSRHLVFKLVCIHSCVHGLYVIYIIVYKTIWNRKKNVFV